ncbi:nitrilase-related carbon-nitrogen hydrolase [Martelella alba]|uniref:CN hydrolase domain-containing protein n=1 Tax=Martelella alba TaxID=2590451 RepID=A0ABY2SI79_9HYPH|nr:nitrilase-related carbon-nitrogen hydrolase [Martelella alba]TKI04233.1 hypothetical protein FCN80_18645 [Martelella alba]
MKLGIAQITGAPADETDIVEWVASAMAGLPDADLIVLPELALCGYDDPERIRRMALDKKGPTLQSLGALAGKKRQALAFGYAERDAAANTLHNAVRVIDGQGRILADYRKIHLWSGYETTLFAPGDGFAGFALGGMRFGLAICYDLDFPEMTRIQAIDGMDCLLCVSATTKGYDVVPRHVVPARAYENGCFVIFANRGDNTGLFPCIGQSRIAGPDGAIIAAVPGEGAALIAGDIDPAFLANWRRTHPYLAERRIRSDFSPV